MLDKPLLLTESIEVKNTLGEGVIWDGDNEKIWWTDIQEKRIYSYRFYPHCLESWDTPERACSLALVEEDSRLLVAFESGFAFYNLKTKAVEWLFRPFSIGEGLRLNDGRVDRQGRFWAGSMVENDRIDEDAGSLYRLNAKASCEMVLSNIRVSSGLCFSPDAKTMYHSDSLKCKIYACDFDTSTGYISNRRVFARTEPHIFPGGACVDSQGYVYSAQWGGQRVVRYSPDGDIDTVISVPASQPSCVTFAGENLDMLVVTSARDTLSVAERNAQWFAGNVFVFQTPYVGLPEPKYKNDLK